MKAKDCYSPDDILQFVRSLPKEEAWQFWRAAWSSDEITKLYLVDQKLMAEEIDRMTYEAVYHDGEYNLDPIDEDPVLFMARNMARWLQFAMDRTENMGRPPRQERSDVVVKLRDEEKLTFKEIGVRLKNLKLEWSDNGKAYSRKRCEMIYRRATGKA